MLSEPLLIRADGGVNPRYPQVVFDGTDFVVAWIQGEKLESSVNGGMYGIFARRVSSAGQLLNGDATTDGFEVMPEIEEPKEYLELYATGSDLLAFWGIIGLRNDSGICGTRFAADFSSVEPAAPVAGTASEAGLTAMDNTKQIAFAPSSTSGLVVWTVENFVKGWYLRQDFPD